MTPQRKYDLEVEGGKIVLEIERIEQEIKYATSNDVKHTWEIMKDERAKRFLAICDELENVAV